MKTVPYTVFYPSPSGVKRPACGHIQWNVSLPGNGGFIGFAADSDIRLLIRRSLVRAQVEEPRLASKINDLDAKASRSFLFAPSVYGTVYGPRSISSSRQSAPIAPPPQQGRALTLEKSNRPAIDMKGTRDG